MGQRRIDQEGYSLVVVGVDQAKMGLSALKEGVDTLC
jgi:hypothetical protein